MLVEFGFQQIRIFIKGVGETQQKNPVREYIAFW